TDRPGANGGPRPTRTQRGTRQGRRRTTTATPAGRHEASSQPPPRSEGRPRPEDEEQGQYADQAEPTAADRLGRRGRRATGGSLIGRGQVGHGRPRRRSDR